MNPLISVVIPCRNEVQAIGATVGALLNSTYPDIEVLIVDGMSDDGTRDVLANLSKVDDRVRVIDNPKRLTPFAFNLGIVNAKGQYVQIVGSRNIVDPDYIRTLYEILATRPDVTCVGGDYQHVYNTDQGRFISLAMESPFGMGVGNYRTMKQDTYVDTVGVPMYRVAIFSEMGPFDETLTRNQDDEFNFRLRQKGSRILYVHKAKVTYLVRGSVEKAFWQFFQYGYFKAFVSLKHRKLTTLRQLVPMLFVALWICGLPLALFFAPARALLLAVAIVYVCTGLMLAGEGLKFSERFAVFKVCLRLHWAYGLGYWQGLWDFLVMDRDPQDQFKKQTT